MDDIGNSLTRIVDSMAVVRDVSPSLIPNTPASNIDYLRFRTDKERNLKKTIGIGTAPDFKLNGINEQAAEPKPLLA